MLSQSSQMPQTEIKVNERNKDRMFLIRKKPPPEWDDGFKSKVRQFLHFTGRRKQEQEDGEFPVPFRPQQSEESLKRHSTFNSKTAGEDNEWKSEVSSDKGQGDTKRKSELEMKEYEEIEILTESDDAEGIVDALLAKYTT